MVSIETSPIAPDSARKQRSSSVAWRRQLPLLIGFLVLLMVAGMSIWLAADSRRHNLLVAHTLQVRSVAYRLLTLLQGAETGQRGYLLTMDRNYLAPYTEGATAAPSTVADLESLTRGNLEEAAPVRDLKTLVGEKLAELAKTIALTDENKPDQALDLVRTNDGSRLMDKIRVRIDAVQAEEARLLSLENTQTSTYGLMLGILSVVGVLTVIGVAFLTLAATRRNIRELEAAQEAMRLTNENLETIVSARVADLQAANDEIQRFAYIVSHDLRAPLVNVMGFTSELEAVRADVVDFLRDVEKHAPNLVTADRRAAVETDLPEALGFIRTSTAKMDRLINAILKLSREGRRVLTPQLIPMRDVILAQRESLSHQLAEEKAVMHVQEDLPDVVSDRLAIEQIFGNLIENATKYLQPGRPGEIQVRGRKIGSFLRYEIIDNGRGIDKKDFERIFELFRRSGEQDKPGEGIGLAYVRGLVRRLGGNVTIASELGKGSTFTITLPAVFSNPDTAV